MTDQPLEEFARRAELGGLFLDFDGTLSEVVHVPSEARPLDGVRDLLDDLARRFRLVSIVSGRSAQQLVEWLGTNVEIWGVHGAQRAIDGRIELSEVAAPFEQIMSDALRDAVAALQRLDLPGALVEDKGVIFNLHWRAAQDRGRARAELSKLARDLAERHGLRRHEGRMSFELRPPVDFSKSDIVLRRAREEGLAAAAFVGDDWVDLPAFDALDELSGEGVATVRVAVASDESPPELLERADVVVDGPAGVLRLLRRL